MLRSGDQQSAGRLVLTGEQLTAPARAGRGERDRGPGAVGLVAAVLGLLGALLAVAVPLLPVIQDTVVITWPRAGRLAPVNAPLVGYQPQRLTATIPCAAAVSVGARSTQPALLLATTPPGSAEGAAVGLALRVVDGTLSLISRGQKLGHVSLGGPPVAAGPCLITLSSNAQGTTASVGGTRFVKVDQDVRPQVTGIYSALDERLDPVTGLSVRITVDTRFQSVPHPVRLVAIALAMPRS